MGINIQTLLMAEKELEIRRKKNLDKYELRKNIFFAKCNRAKEIEELLSRTAIDAAKAVLSGLDAKAILSKLRESNLSLQSELKNLLILNQLPSDYLNVKYDCKKCQDTGYIDGVMCDCLKSLIKQLTYDNLNKLSPLSLSTFESFSTDCYPDQLTADGVNIRQHMINIFDFCYTYAEKFDKDSKNLFMQGATGLGKTHLSLAIANAAINNGFNVIYTSTPNIISQLEKEHFRHTAIGNETEKHLLNCELLILDDLGTEFQTNFSNSVIYNIINCRIMYHMPTIISTNLSVREIQKEYSKRLVSRIMGDYKRLFFIGNDMRQYLKNKQKIDL